ncbi:MAG TPA: alpha/beta hydrolase, partial [Vicinamibacteria bacterium]|nr:alpha/beta hydrolase [Vicinamibacteria bacterium]
MLLPAIAASAEPPKGALPGERVDIGGRTLHLLCTGSGRPTVVFEAGGGRFSQHWSAVQGLASSRFMTCSYDRAGLGSSDAPPVVPH